jgi:hypothetical protein
VQPAVTGSDAGKEPLLTQEDLPLNDVEAVSTR